MRAVWLQDSCQQIKKQMQQKEESKRKEAGAGVTALSVVGIGMTTRRLVNKIGMPKVLSGLGVMHHHEHQLAEHPPVCPLRNRPKCKQSWKRRIEVLRNLVCTSQISVGMKPFARLGFAVSLSLRKGTFQLPSLLATNWTHLSLLRLCVMLIRALVPK